MRGVPAFKNIYIEYRDIEPATVAASAHTEVKKMRSYLILQLFFSASTVARSGLPVTCMRYLAHMPYTLDIKKLQSE